MNDEASDHDADDPCPVAEALRGRLEVFVEQLREIVDIDSGTYHRQGVQRMVDWCQSRLEGIGFSIDRISPPPEGEPRSGDVLVGRIRGGGNARILLVGHVDTVFPPGTTAERPFHTEGPCAYGPGVSDRKGGLLVGMHAVESLRDVHGLPFGECVFVCNPDEEVGSPFSKPIIEELARDVDVAFVLEAARQNGDIVSARKGALGCRS
jgi:glutamate carboxypeptidase